MMRSRLAGAAIAAGVVFHALPALAPVATPVARGLRIPRRVEGAEGVVLTFDDGPHPRGTEAVLEVLRAANAKALFFLVSEQVELRPALAGEIAAAGHGIALHCRRHRNLLRLTPRQIAEDLERAAATIAGATGRAPALHRPPYGIYSGPSLPIVRSRWQPLLWSRWGHDWSRRATARSIAEEVTRGLTAGDVLLLHDSDAYSVEGSWRQTASALPHVLEELARLDLPAELPSGPEHW
jgi:peptidoglycan/xylan/chitin deacetylase (PgdA/CDA1 family)